MRVFLPFLWLLLNLVRTVFQVVKAGKVQVSSRIELNRQQQIRRNVFDLTLRCPALKVIERLDYIRNLQLNIETKEIHPNRLRHLSRLGARYEPQSFRRFHEAKRYTVLVAYLLDLSQDLVNQAFEIHDKQILTFQSKGWKQQEEL
ncbi:hypothetical protein AYJ08_00635 [Brevibacillus sp. SKDU10]|nr:hypothetical protein AYJ08_00635 [Brevibacillus sp. SKDU10]